MCLLKLRETMDVKELNLFFLFSKSKRLQNQWIQNMSTKNILIKYERDMSKILVQNISTYLLTYSMVKSPS